MSCTLHMLSRHSAKISTIIHTILISMMYRSLRLKGREEIDFTSYLPYIVLYLWLPLSPTPPLSSALYVTWGRRFSNFSLYSPAPAEPEFRWSRKEIISPAVRIPYWGLGGEPILIERSNPPETSLPFFILGSFLSLIDVIQLDLHRVRVLYIFIFLCTGCVSYALSGPKKSRISGPTPSNGPWNGFARIKIIMFRTIWTTGSLIVIIDLSVTVVLSVTYSGLSTVVTLVLLVLN